MSRPPRTTSRHLVPPAALSVLVATAVLAGPAPAANPDACGLVTQHTMARAFAFTDTAQQKSVLRAPGNPAGVVHIRCRGMAWKGKKPSSAAQERDAIRAGTVATYRIDTWVADSGPAASTWLSNFKKKLEGLRSRAKEQFLQSSLAGRSFTPPKFGLPSSVGYQASSGGLRKLRAFWWNRESGTLISFNVVEDRDKPTAASVKKLASKIVPKLE